MAKEMEKVISAQQAELREKVMGVMTSKKHSAADIARITKKAESTISYLLSGKYVGPDSISEISTALSNYLGESHLIKTRQYECIMTMADKAKTQKDMRLIVGNSGIGKSTVFRDFAKNAACCCYYKVTDSKLSWNKLLHDLCVGFGIILDKTMKRYTTQYLLEKIVAHASKHVDEHPMVIIDEAEVMRSALFKELKNLFTATEGMLSIVIVGITELAARIARLAGLDPQTWEPCRTDSNQYTTFARRMKKMRIDNISKDDIAALCKTVGIVNKEIIELAQRKWWNYGEAMVQINRAKGMKFDFATMDTKRFESLEIQ